MAENTRRHFSPEEKVAILRRHLLEIVPVSELCDQHGIAPRKEMMLRFAL